MADAPPGPPLVLASRSPQRKAILEQLRIPFDVVPPRYEEETPRHGDAVAIVREHARAKARSVDADTDDRPVLGVDTEVALDGAIFGKPNLDSVGTFTINNAHFSIGLVLTALVNFVIVAAAIYFFVVVPVNAMRARYEKPAPAEDTGPTEVELLAQIRDELRART